MATTVEDPRPRKPPLYQLARGLQYAGIIALVIVLIYVVSILVSALADHPKVSPDQSGGTGGGSLQELPDGEYAISMETAVSNPGFYSMTVMIAAQVTLGSGPVLVHGSSSSVTVAPGATQSVTVLAPIPTDLFSEYAVLVTQDVELNGTVWVNGTYSQLFTFSVAVPGNETWGAPFYDLEAQPGTPVSGAGGEEVPVQLSFTNQAAGPDDGTLTLTAETASGASCGANTFSLDVDPGSTYNQTLDVSASSGCDLTGGSLHGSYTAGDLTVPLPTEALP